MPRPLAGRTARARDGEPFSQMQNHARLGRIDSEAKDMRSYNAVIERDTQTGVYVGYVPGWPGAHSQGETIDELRTNLEEVLAMLLEDGEPQLESDFIGTQALQVA